MSYILLQNARTKEKCELITPFNQTDYLGSLESIGIQGDRTKLLSGEDIDGLEVEDLSTNTPIHHIMLGCQNPVLIGIAEQLYDDANYPTYVDEFADLIGVDDIFEFCNLCTQSDEIYFIPYEYGYDYEGYGRTLINQYYDESIPDWIESYIDYESYGRDQAMNGYDYVGECGYIPGDDVNVDLEELDKEAIFDQCDWEIELSDEEWEDIGETAYAKRAAMHRMEQEMSQWKPQSMSLDSLIQIL